MTDQPRIFYALGPGDAVDSYRKWSGGIDYTAETSLTFSGQFFEFCRAHGLQAYAISSHSSRELLRDGPFIVENRPKPLAHPRGLWYHLNQVWYGLSLLLSALRYGAHVVIVDSGTTHWFVLALLSLTRVRVVACLYNTYWPSGYVPSGVVKRAIRALDGWFWRTRADATLCLSPECQRQVEELAQTRNRPVFQFRPQYHPSDFQSVPPPPPHDARPFRVIFVGRVEREKGVFDLLEIAKCLERKSPGQLRFEICGGGDALEELTKTIEERRLGDVVQLRGRLSRPDLLAAYGKSHLVIVPTRSSFAEGLAMTAAEAILAGRPVLTNPVVPALELLRPACVEARTNDVDSYVEGILKLFNDSNYYNSLCQACPSLQKQFYDRGQGLGAALERAMQSFDAALLTPSPQHLA